LSQIFALLFMATFAIFLFPTSRRQRIWLLATAPLVGFACNALRIAALAILADRGERRLFDAWHDGALSPLCTVFAVGLALAIWLPLLRRQPHGPPTDGEPA
jgi:exosortase/archaeosortase family protein